MKTTRQMFVTTSFQQDALIQSQPRRSHLNQSGMITLDFIFAFVFAFGFVAILFAISFALAGVEISQYVTYAVSRAYTGAHETEGQQRALANQKFTELMDKGVFKTFYRSGWFTLSPPQIGDLGALYPGGANSDTEVFVGVRIPMHARITALRLPLLGATAENSTTGRATLNSYLMRDVSTTECREKFNSERGSKLQALEASGSNPYAGVANKLKYILITDNGC